MSSSKGPASMTTDAAASTQAAAPESDALAALADALRQEVMERWPNYYPERAGTSATLTLTTRHFGFSVLFAAALEFPDGAERFMIKVRRKHRDGSVQPDEITDRTRQFATTEYEQHVKAYTFFEHNGAGLSVVRPLDFIPEFNAFLVQHANGKDLSKIVRDGGGNTLPSLERCGHWWRLFHHDLHQAQMRAWDSATIDRGLERRLLRLRSIGAPQDVAEELAAKMRAVARRVSPSLVPVSVIHGDCKLRHVWATNDRIQVLDFGNTKLGDSWIDPAALVVELTLASLWSSRFGTPTHTPHMRVLLDAYFSGRPPDAFWLYVADTLFKKWHRRLRKWGPGAGISRIRQSLRRVRLDKSVERLYIDRWFSSQIQAWVALADGRPPAWMRPLID